MRAKNIIKLLPKNLFSFLSKKYKVDHKVKKLEGQRLFMLLLHSMFSEKSISLRKLKAKFEQEKFQKNSLNRPAQEVTTINHTALHYRFNTINPLYFRDIYQAALKKFKPLLANIKVKYDVLRFDSTMVTLSTKLLKQTGFQAAGPNSSTKGIKFTIGYDNLPQVVRIYSEKSYKSENKALKETILSENILERKIILFDRGLNSRDAFDQITKRGNYFVGRSNKDYRADIVSSTTLAASTQGDLQIVKDVKGYLYNKEGKRSTSIYRIVHVKVKSREKKPLDKKTQTLAHLRLQSAKHAGKSKEQVIDEIKREDLFFVTNILDASISGEEIAAMYKKRWDIEVFFKFLKQELDFSHLLNRSPQGIESLLYLRLTFAILLLVYKHLNKLTGYKLVKYRLMLELEDELCEVAILVSGGSISKWKNAPATQFWELEGAPLT